MRSWDIAELRRHRSFFFPYSGKPNLKTPRRCSVLNLQGKLVNMTIPRNKAKLVKVPTSILPDKSTKHLFMPCLMAFIPTSFSNVNDFLRSIKEKLNFCNPIFSRFPHLLFFSSISTIQGKYRNTKWLGLYLNRCRNTLQHKPQ